MRLISYINNQKCLEWGLNLQQGALFDLLNQSSSWADPIYIDGKVFYWVSKNKICSEIPLAYSKKDTVYRALKVLVEKGLILYVKHEGKDCIVLTSKGKEWNSELNPTLGNKSESSGNDSEINPKNLGNKSDTRKNIRENSEINPTYNNTNINTSSSGSSNNLPENAHQQIIDKWNASGFVQIKAIVSGSQREKLLKARIKEFSLEQVLEAIDIANQSEFLKGGGSKGWVMDFTWFLRPNNFIKVYENKYANRPVAEGVNHATHSSNPNRKLSAVERVRIANERARAQRAAQNSGARANLGVYEPNVR
ncbi:hypothetical protein [Wohlfahrtiimonas sp. G9077]|uniref:hypothetical protein n=1 Tax=Wohlfahrtiimonas sp. G9077 TaxID=1980118 RepID=UPI0018F1156E|nr:hypothetical protein [Wohlfahrtiimonas sp. G9077]